MALTVLLTGFGPFPGAPINPTGKLVRTLARLRRPARFDVRLVPHIFQTSYQAVDADLPRLLAQVKPDAVLMFGLSGKAQSLRVETRARNATSLLTRDAMGKFFTTGSILPGGPAVLTFALPASRLALTACRARAKAVASRDAGRYLCNYLCWRAIEGTAQPQGPKLTAFVHMPHPKGRGRSMADLQRGAEAILLASVAETRRRMAKR